MANLNEGERIKIISDLSEVIDYVNEINEKWNESNARSILRHITSYSHGVGTTDIDRNFEDLKRNLERLRSKVNER